MKKYTFLVEVGTESLPSKFLKKLGKDFFYQIVSGLKKNNFVCDKVNWFASAYRLAVKASIGIKEDYHHHNITSVNQINNDDIHNKYVKNTYNQENFVTSKMHIQNNTQTDNYQGILKYDDNVGVDKNYNCLFCGIIRAALEKLNNYTMMRWGDIDIPFVRPVRTMTILLDTYLIQGCFFGIKTDRVLYGNICMQDNKIILEHADYYPDVLIKNGWVIADYNARKNVIRSAVEKEAAKLGGVIDIQDNSLLEEITSLVEWPVVLFGQFNEKFLALPHEVILHIMRYDQRYFPVYNFINGMLLPYFIFVANTISSNYEEIIIGHENVIIPRLMDAEFFLKDDNKCRLEDYIPKLNSVLFHRKLGTLRDKSWRIEELSGWIAHHIGADIQETKRAGYLCKADLMSNMVFEFPSTQGTIGMYYARRDGESENIAIAQKEHYQPRFSEDKLPTTYVSCAVSIADKMDTISGIFGIKEFPKGNRDPFALKRSAIGILRILIYKKLPLNLLSLIEKSVTLYGEQLINATVINDIHNFMYNRLFSWYSSKGYGSDIVKAVLTVKTADIVDINARIEAVANFCKFKKEENIKLNLIYKRISNIVSKKQMLFDDVKFCLLKNPEEINLAMQVISIEDKLQKLCTQRRYYDALVVIVTIFSAVNIFFDNVMIMDKNENVQINRLTLLNKAKNLFLKVADISLLHL